MAMVQVDDGGIVKRDTKAVLNEKSVGRVRFRYLFSSSLHPLTQRKMSQVWLDA